MFSQRLVERRTGRFRHHPGVLWGAMGGGERSEIKAKKKKKSSLASDHSAPESRLQLSGGALAGRVQGLVFSLWHCTGGRAGQD